MTNHDKPDGPFKVYTYPEDGEVLVIGKNRGLVAAYLSCDGVFSIDDARRHAEAFAAKLNAEVTAKEKTDCAYEEWCQRLLPE